MEQNIIYAPSGYCYWTSRLIEAERQYARSANPDLMKVYTELMRHYEKMAKLHKADSQISVLDGQLELKAEPSLICRSV